MGWSSWTVLAAVVIPVILCMPILTYKILKTPLFVLAALLLILPFHTITFQVIRVELGLPTTISLLLQSWKELLVLILLVPVLANTAITGKYTGPAPTVFFICLLFIFSGFIGIFTSPDLLTAVFGLRGTLTPFVVLALMLCLPITITWVRKITVLIFMVGTLVAGFAVFQSLVLGFQFIQKYYALDGMIPTSFSFAGGTIQRAMGTFSSPNQLSLYLVFLILIAVNLLLRSEFRQHKMLFIAGIAVMILALMLTVSRSGWIALLVGLGISFLIWRHKNQFIVAAVIGVLIVVPTFFMFDLDRHLVNTIRGNDPSANYRTKVAGENISTILNNPLGVGLGVVGARAYRAREFGIQTYPTESYLLQLAMEVGIIGFTLFSLLMTILAANLYKNIYRVRSTFARGWIVAALSCLFAALAHAVFIPDLQDLTVATYLSVILAIGVWLPRVEQRVSHTDRSNVVAAAS